jgi:hypothetical protein
MDKFGWRCRGCGETHVLEPSSTIRCEWCDISDPFGGDKCYTRPTLKSLFAEYRRIAEIKSNSADARE